MSILPPPPTHQARRSPTVELSPFPSTDLQNQRPEINGPLDSQDKPSHPIFGNFNMLGGPQNNSTQSDSPTQSEGNSPESSRSSSDASQYVLEKNLPNPPYHVFSMARKKQLVYIVSLAGLFSPLSSNIYFPALGDIALVSSLLLVGLVLHF